MLRSSLRLLAVVAATALGGVAQAGCGGDESGLLPRAGAAELQADLDAVEAAVDAARCEEAQAALSEVRGALVNLPESVDADLRARLQEGIDNLDTRVSATCGQDAQPEVDPGLEPQEPAPQDTDGGEETTPPQTDTGEETTPPQTDTGEEPAPEVPGAGGPESDGGGTGGASPDGDGE